MLIPMAANNRWSHDEGELSVMITSAYPFGVNRLAKFRVSRESALLRVDLRVH
ncbi:hypothetical protein QO004_002722 [Rhizobium mesoamericanum]|nr:hypothetical protein [Rhizobium mesoamericanum]